MPNEPHSCRSLTPLHTMYLPVPPHSWLRAKERTKTAGGNGTTTGEDKDALLQPLGFEKMHFTTHPSHLFSLTEIESDLRLRLAGPGQSLGWTGTSASHFTIPLHKVSSISAFALLSPPELVTEPLRRAWDFSRFSYPFVFTFSRFLYFKADFH
jgi:hypothetical protein